MKKSYKIIKHNPNYYNKQIAENFDISLEYYNSLTVEEQNNYKERTLDAIEHTDYDDMKKIKPKDFIFSGAAAGIILATMAQAIDRGPEAFAKCGIFLTSGLLTAQAIKIMIKRLGVNMEEKKANELIDYITSTNHSIEDSYDGRTR